MKKVALIAVPILSLLGVGAASLYVSDSPQSKMAQSQHDTAIDFSSQKDFFEYSLSGLGEYSLEEIQENIEESISQQNSLGIDVELFQTYLAYKRALSKLEPLEDTTLSLSQLQRLNEAILNLQLEYFNDQQISQLFDEENRLRQLAIEKLVIKTYEQDSDSQQLLLNQALSEQPEYIQQSERNNALTRQLDQTALLSSQDKYLARVELVGEDGAQRLQKLDEQRAAFETELTNYLEKRADILDDEFLDSEQKQLEIANLRKQSFETTQWRRIEALERIHDSQN
ncbi:TPA: lipase secretion chaperone [Vibrio parahaemolyticus]|uniref:lipase secretion chaperone n=1 Tax=Vibrio parahaemolyticus TaxID=670 RepID=UPI00030C0D2D|nr:lipase secretion chaperone [Vibrio parahaemolyticus]EIO3705470.1 lipase secretion chaperone [Vibrio parahaemolyticus]EJA7339736.1 lipase secretion chaperone [Vibrio parahaemolyticus]MBY3748465.1 lipase secretion chaperone [Vibrio parahaemolyticus]MBY3758360.1 lipase secretion chaperone [Vibrio parahaemolyticus]MBY3765895.1 lipase secretion chaperone [Vibrio parahaemolyticus]